LNCFIGPWSDIVYFHQTGDQTMLITPPKSVIIIKNNQRQQPFSQCPRNKNVKKAL